MTIWHGRGAVGEPAGDAGPHPSIEEIAALIDGRLEEAERDRVAGHLADCAECYELFVETASFQQEEGADDPVVVPFRRRRFSPFGNRKRLGRVAELAGAEGGVLQARGERLRRAGWLAVAAILLLAIGIPVYRSLVGPQDTPEMVVADLVAPVVAPLAGKIDPGLTLFALGTDRGADDQPSKLTPDSFMIGALLVDLRLSLEAGKSDVAQELARRAAILVDRKGSLGADQARFFWDIVSGLEAGQPPASYLDHLPTSENPPGDEAVGLVHLYDSDFMDFGKWAAAGLLWAEAQQPGFFEDDDTWRFLEQLKREHAELLDQQVVDPLMRIEATAKEDEDLSAADYQALAEEFKSIIERYDFLSRRQESTEF